MGKDKVSIQSTLFAKKDNLSYYGLNAWGETILIPNFQPLDQDDNPRLDVENNKTKRKKKRDKNE